MRPATRLSLSTQRLVAVLGRRSCHASCATVSCTRSGKRAALTHRSAAVLWPCTRAAAYGSTLTQSTCRPSRLPAPDFAPALPCSLVRAIAARCPPTAPPPVPAMSKCEGASNGEESLKVRQTIDISAPAASSSSGSAAQSSPATSPQLQPMSGGVTPTPKLRSARKVLPDTFDVHECFYPRQSARAEGHAAAGREPLRADREHWHGPCFARTN